MCVCHLMWETSLPANVRTKQIHWVFIPGINWVDKKKLQWYDAFQGFKHRGGFWDVDHWKSIGSRKKQLSSCQIQRQLPRTFSCFLLLCPSFVDKKSPFFLLKPPFVGVPVNWTKHSKTSNPTPPRAPRSRIQGHLLTSDSTTTWQARHEASLINMAMQRSATESRVVHEVWLRDWVSMDAQIWSLFMRHHPRWVATPQIFWRLKVPEFPDVTTLTSMKGCGLFQSAQEPLSPWTSCWH